MKRDFEMSIFWGGFVDGSLRSKFNKEFNRETNYCNSELNGPKPRCEVKSIIKL